MAPGTLKLKLGTARGDGLQHASPGDTLFFVLGVGPTRYRSASAPASRPTWDENFQFTIANETHLDVECWRGGHAEALLARGTIHIPGTSVGGTEVREMVKMMGTNGPQQLYVDILFTFSSFEPPPSGSHSSSNPFTNPYGIPSQVTPYPSPTSAPYPPVSQATSAPYPPPLAGTSVAPYPLETGLGAAGGASAFSSATYPSPIQAQSAPPATKYHSEPPKKLSHEYSYAPPPAPAGYSGASSSGLPPAGYPSQGQGHHSQLYNKPMKHGKHGKYPSGVGMAAGGLAMGALAGVAAGALMSGGMKPFKHKGFGFKGHKGFFGFKGHKGFGFKGPKGFGFKGHKGFGFK